MATKIQWTEQTWNPIAGCSLVSPGCKNCYAMNMAARLEAMGQEKYRGLTKKVGGRPVWTGAITLDEEALSIPLKRRKPTMYFVNSMSDLFHKDVPDEFITAVFGVMAACPQHTFQVLTKRAERIHDWSAKMDAAGGVGVYIRSEAGRSALRGYFDAVSKTEVIYGKRERSIDDPWMQVINGAACSFSRAPLSNVWLGVSAEDQQRANERIPWLLKTPAAVRFVSAEPLLGPINFGDDLLPRLSDMRGILTKEWVPKSVGIDWVIVGGESGHGARPCNVEWIRSIVQQCKAADVKVFVKQLGDQLDMPLLRCPQCGHIDDTSGFDVLGADGDNLFCQRCHHEADMPEAKQGPKGGDLNQWPEDLRVREFPQ